MSRIFIGVVVALGAVVWASYLLFEGWSMSASFFKPYSIVVTVVGGVLLAWEKWLWRWSFLHPWLVERPDLRGTWKGTLESRWQDHVTGERSLPIAAYLVVRQTYSTMHVVLFTEESSSESVAAYIVEGNGGAQLWYAYRNEPGLKVQDRSRIHHGSVRLSVHGPHSPKLAGHYWTDRDTKGELTFQLVSRRLASSFERAADLARQSGPVIETG